jgi:hypothetical protein
MVQYAWYQMSHRTFVGDGEMVAVSDVVSSSRCPDAGEISKC